MPRYLRSLRAKNFRSLADVDVTFSDLNVLIGPNGSGKSNLLKVLSFVRDTARFDIGRAVDLMGGLHHVMRRFDDADTMELTIEGVITQNANGNTRDSYTLKIHETDDSVNRHEEFKYKRVAGQGRRYTLKATGRDVVGSDNDGTRRERDRLLQLASADISALGALSKVSDEYLGTGPSEFFSFLSGIRYLDPNVDAAKAPSRIAQASLSDDASNLASALFTLQDQSPDSFLELQRDLARCLPGLESISFDPYGGSMASIVVRLHERGLNAPIDLADASFGTVRILALLVALHEPHPPSLTIIEEVDHGLHPYALDVLVDRLRDAARRTQIIVASHSPTLVNRLAPNEIIICDRDSSTGESIIPATTPQEIADAVASGDWRAGELWFSGALGGVPQ